MALGAGGGGGASSRAIEAGRAFVRLGAKDDLSAHLKRIAAKFGEFGQAAIKLTGIGGILGGVIGGLSFKDTADDLKDMNDAAKALGVNGRQASGLFGVLNAAGGDFKENVEGLTQFSNAIQEATANTGKTTALFEGLSVSAKDLADVPLDEQFYKIHEAIRQLPQEQQAYKLGLVGGTDSMKKWLPLLSMSTDQLRGQAQALALSSAELEQGAEASKAMKQAGAALGGAWQRAVVIVAPLVTQLATGLADALRPVGEFLKDRGIEDLAAEAGARLGQLWGEAKWGAINFVADTIDFFTSGWDSAVLLVKNMFADLGQFAAKAMRQAVDGPLSLLERVNPIMAGQLRAALGAGEAGANAVGEAMRRQAQDEFDANARLRRATREELAKQRQADKDAADGGLNAVLDGVERKRNARVFAEFMDGMQAPAAAVAAKQIGDALGTFGDGGRFLGQMFGGNGNLPKQQLDAQRQANAILTAIRDGIAGLTPLAFT